jgi:hypothetical protein
MDRAHVVTSLRIAIERAGSVRSWAKTNSFAESYVRVMLKGHKEPSERVLKALGLRRVERYEVAV